MPALKCFSQGVCNLPITPVSSTSKLSSKHLAMQAHWRMVSSTYPSTVYLPAVTCPCPPPLAVDPSGTELAEWVGKMWYNTTSGIVKYYNGTEILEVLYT